LYIHVPFCRSKCGYCDFYSLPDPDGLAEAFVRAVLQELQRNSDCLAATLQSVFVGGGTPTVLKIPLLKQLLAAVRPYLDDRTEFSVEANPCTVSDGVAAVLSDSGVNRVNIGAQSFVPDELSVLGRTHSTGDIDAAWTALRRARIPRLGLDLIYGVPGQTAETWRRSLETALDLKPDHLSCYALTIERGAPMQRRFDSGELTEMSESLQADCYHAAVRTARTARLEQYEISNFAAPENRCMHNLTYWRNRPYVGLGPAAASYVNSVRRTNEPDVEAYISALASGRRPPSRSEKLTGRAEMGETIMLALRMVEGLDRRQFARRFGCDAAEAFAGTVRRYRRQGALVLTDTHLRIAPQAMLVSNTILADILAEV